MTIDQQITFLDTRDLTRTDDFYGRSLTLVTDRVDEMCAHLERDRVEFVEIQRFWEPLV